MWDLPSRSLAVQPTERQAGKAPDFPNIRAISLEYRPSPVNPLGVKGAGEGGIIPVGGLLANAVASALSSLGAMPNVLPLSPPRVWRLAKPLANPER